MSPESKSISCPQCGQADKVQAAESANIAAPIQASDTPLKIVKVIQWVFGIAFSLALLTMCVFIGGTLLFTGWTVMTASSYDPTGELSSLFPILGASILPILCIFPVILVVGGGLMIGLPWLMHRLANDRSKAKNAEWQHAPEKYKRLYHCAWCAGVFLEGQERVVPIEQLQPFLYEIKDPEII